MRPKRFTFKSVYHVMKQGSSVTSALRAAGPCVAAMEVMAHLVDRWLVVVGRMRLLQASRHTRVPAETIGHYASLRARRTVMRMLGQRHSYGVRQTTRRLMSKASGTAC